MTTTAVKTLNIDGIEVPINGERNLLELIRKADIDLPTFCYHSDLSVYGACRLCIVDIAGRGIQGACSTPPEPGLKIRTQTEEIREIRKISVELLLANHERECTTCVKSAACQLQDVARKLGIQKVRFKPVHEPVPVDRSSLSLVRDPNKCVLCGDCVRFCSEIQGIGAIDFAYRGHDATVLPAFGKDLGEGECTNCGQCAAVCPTGALTPKQEIEEVWKALGDPTKTVVAQIAPAVRVAIGELFGMPPGESTRGQMVAALKRLGFKHVYDTAFSADLTVIEEANEFLGRKTKGGKLPLFTSCCPGWVKFAEQYFPELLPNLSTCKSPQQMLGALVKELLPAELGVEKKKLVMVSIMPCTAKKFEAKRPEFARDGIAEVDHVLTTQELARMIEEAGLRFMKLQPESFDMPMGFKTGAGVIFGNSGGVSEAVLRYAAEKVTGKKLTNPDFHAVRGEDGLRIVEVPVGDITLKLGIVHGLKNARTLAEKARRGKCDLDIIEVMACPGGCIGGAGQPVSREPDIRKLRTRGLYDVDKNMELHKSQENHFVTECYQRHLGEIGGKNAHRLLHTHHHNRRRIAGEAIELGEGGGAEKLKVNVCTGTNCFVKGSQHILHDLLQEVDAEGLQDKVAISASFCFEKCDHGPTVSVDGNKIKWCTAQAAKSEILQKLKEKKFMKTTLPQTRTTIINEAEINAMLAVARRSDSVRVREVLAKARLMDGLDADDVAVLMEIQDATLLEEMFAAARFVKDEIYGNRLVLFAPLYISNLCKNECSYCAFRAGNTELTRRTLTQDEIAAEVKVLIDQGHKRLLLVSGEEYPEEGFNYVLKALETIYKTKSERGEIRRVNVNIAPLTVEQFKQLKAAHIGTYQLFQETYHRETYARIHTAGAKKNYDWRVTVMDRAVEAGIDDYGIGVLFGLYDWKFEMLALQQHIQHMEEKFGVGPHTLSVPRLEPAGGSEIASRPPHAVSDADFKKIVAILRLAVPYTGIIMSTRENAETRRATFALGVSQISAGSRCNPGGYAELGDRHDAEQFQLGDHRSLDETVRDVASLGYTPSFCTACYRMGRTGADFMDLAKPGLIKEHCSPNALSSCMEYLMGYAAPETRVTGEMLVDHELATMPGKVGDTARELVGRVRQNERDAFV